MDAQQYLMGYLPVVHLVQQATNGLSPINSIYTGPLFVDTPDKANAFYLASQPLKIQDTDARFPANRRARFRRRISFRARFVR